jgi:serine/threonine-protein kinase
VFGTPVYMSPEQVRGQAAADHRADLWALACITYECLTGTTVWSTDDGVAMTFAQIATAPLPDPAHYRPDLPASFNAWYARALDRDIDKRFQDVAKFANALAEAFDYETKAGIIETSLVRHITSRAHGQSPPDSSRWRKDNGSSEATARAHVQQSAPARRVQPKRPSAASEPMSLQRLTQETMPPRIPRVVVSGRLVAAAVGATIVLLIILGIALSGDDPQPLVDLKRVGALADRFIESDQQKAAGLRVVSRHRWLPRIREAQMRIARGEPERAMTILKRIAETHRHGMITNLVAQVQIAIDAKQQGARCVVTGYARPRRYNLLDKSLAPARDTTPPTIVPGIGGPVMAWADLREGKRRAFAVPLDASLRNRALPVDITPETTRVRTPTLMPVAKRFLAAYWDSRGPAPGVYLRWLRSNAVIDTPPLLVSKNKPGSYYAHAARDDRGGFIVAWAGQRDSDSVDLMLRRYTADLDAQSEAIRATDFIRQGHQMTRVSKIRIGVSARWMHLAYLVAEGTTQQLRYQTLPMNIKAPGLTDDGDRGSRTLGDEQNITGPRIKAGAPSLGCTDEGCFVAWQRTHQGGAGVAFIDADTRRVQWHKLFSPSGRFPSIGVSPKGQVQLVWVQSNRLTTASLGREGVGTRNRVARVSNTQAAPSIAPGSKSGEWYLSWLDRESNRAEPYAARIQCR